MVCRNEIGRCWQSASWAPVIVAGAAAARASMACSPYSMRAVICMSGRGECFRRGVHPDVDGVIWLDVQGGRGAPGYLHPGVVVGDGQLQPHLESEAGDAFDGGRGAAGAGVVDHLDVVRADQAAVDLGDRAEE